MDNPSLADPSASTNRAGSALRAGLVFALLYIFLVGVKGLEAAIGAFGEDFADRVFENVTNPVAGLCAGILATVLVQSSSVTSATIVGLVGAGALPLDAAVPMIMGSNLGTTVTNTLVSLGHVRQGPEFRRAFAGATVHDYFNLLTVAIALPLELSTRFLSRFAEWLTTLLGRSESLASVTVESPIKAAVSWPLDHIESWIAAVPNVGRGVILLIVGIGLIFMALTFITKTMRVLLAGGIERSVNRMLDKGAGMGAMLLGMVITVMVQSSSITTSILIPMVAAGLLTLQNAYPVTLGANVGTTVTALLASVAAVAPEALTVALVHTAFNVFGILLFYPLRFMREIPLRLATATAAVAQEHRSMVVAYVGALFVGLPLLGLVLLA